MFGMYFAFGGCIRHVHPLLIFTSVERWTSVDFKSNWERDRNGEEDRSGEVTQTSGVEYTLV